MKEPVKATFISRKFWFGKNYELIPDEQTEVINMFYNQRGNLEKRRGWRYFGDMVHELWRINKIAQKSGMRSEITVTIPLPGRKPIFKKTLEDK